MTVYGYARVSTNSQDLSDQVEQLKHAGVPENCIYQEKFTGTTSKRPAFMSLQEQLRPGDELVVTKIDRLGRNTSNIISFLDDCTSNNITVNILNMGRLDSSAAGKLMRNVISAFAEFERDMIVSRTAEGKRYAKQHNKDYHEGRPRRVITKRYKEIYDYSLSHSISKTALVTGVSESTVKRIRRQIRSEK
ncbi:recombinase family protein [Pediococcus acidilactici]